MEKAEEGGSKPLEARLADAHQKLAAQLEERIATMLAGHHTSLLADVAKLVNGSPRSHGGLIPALTPPSPKSRRRATTRDSDDVDRHAPPAAPHSRTTSVESDAVDRPTSSGSAGLVDRDRPATSLVDRHATTGSCSVALAGSMNSNESVEHLPSNLSQGTPSKKTKGARRITRLSIISAQFRAIRATAMRGSNGGDPRGSTGASRGRCCGVAGAIVFRREFECAVALLILGNTASIGYNADWGIKHPGQELPLEYRIFDVFFLAAFAVELLVRLFAEGPKFFHVRNRNFGWNVFDTFIVLITSLNEVNPLRMNLTVVRATRPLRIVHVVRMLRFMTFFQELRALVAGIMNCGATLFWTFLLLTIISYIYAVFCLQVLAGWLASVDGEAAQRDDTLQETVDTMKSNFSSLPWSAYTLFKAISGGMDWGDDLADHLYQVGAMMVVSFVLYIGVTMFCVLNVVTAAFVDAAARRSSDHDAKLVEHIDSQKKWIDKIHDLFGTHDVGQDGVLDWAEFKSVFEDWRAQALFMEIGLDLDFQQAGHLFNLFDMDGDGLININEFVLGCHQLKGPARSLDMYLNFQRLFRRLDRVLVVLGDTNSGAQMLRMSSSMRSMPTAMKDKRPEKKPTPTLAVPRNNSGNLRPTDGSQSPRRKAASYQFDQDDGRVEV